MAEQEQKSTSLTQPVRSRANLKQLLELNKESIAAVIPAYLTPEKILKVVMLSAMANPDIFECTKESILKAVMVSANTGIPIGPNSGHIVPFNKKVKAKGNVPEHWVKEAQFIADYRGIIAQAKRCNAITKAESHLVYEEDEFEIDWGNEDKPLTHKPNFLSSKRKPENVIAAYFRAKLPDGDYQYEVMTKDELDGIKERSKAKDFGPWKTDPGQMYRKTVTKRGMNYIPTLDDRTIAAIQHDNAVDAGENIDVVGLLQDINAETAPQMTAPDQKYPEQEDRNTEARSKLDTVAAKVAAAKERAAESSAKETTATEPVETKPAEPNAESKPSAPVVEKSKSVPKKVETPKPWEKKKADVPEQKSLEAKVVEMAKERATAKVETTGRHKPKQAAINEIPMPLYADVADDDTAITDDQKEEMVELMEELLTLSQADMQGEPAIKWLNDTVGSWVGLPLDKINQATATALTKVLEFRVERIKSK